jgi:hypothetical protein|tara:strand:+ start:2390 stop:2590 length:201 start_codon:yes stop_codon:yes gene_type:complete
MGTLSQWLHPLHGHIGEEALGYHSHSANRLSHVLVVVGEYGLTGWWWLRYLLLRLLLWLLSGVVLL